MQSVARDGSMMLTVLLILGGIYTAATTGYQDSPLPPLPVQEAAQVPEPNIKQLEDRIAALESNVADLVREFEQLRAQSAGKALQPKVEPPPVEPAPQIEEQAQVVEQEEPDDSQRSEVQRSVIRMFTRPSCPPCATWWAKERPKLEAAGWVVEKVETSTGTTPRFEVETGGTTRLFQGYMSMPNLRAMLGTEVTSVQSYRPRYTHPGIIWDHLLQGHGISNAYELSRNEAYRLHDELEDQIQGLP